MINPLDLSKRLVLAASVSVMAIACAPLSAEPVAIAYDDQEAAQEDKKSEKKRVVIIDRKNAKHVRGGQGGMHGFAFAGHHSDEERQEALDKVSASLDSVKAQLEQAKADKEEYAVTALESAVIGLEAAKKSLENNAVNGNFVVRGMPDGGNFEFVIKEALGDLELGETDLKEMRIELRAKLEEAREDIEETRREIEMEIENDSEEREFHIKMLVDAEFDMEKMEEHHLKALKKAEEELRRSREKLEKKLADRKKKEAEKKND